jgi:hypothetical protein
VTPRATACTHSPPPSTTSCPAPASSLFGYAIDTIKGGAPRACVAAAYKSCWLAKYATDAVLADFEYAIHALPMSSPSPFAGHTSSATQSCQRHCCQRYVMGHHLRHRHYHQHGLPWYPHPQQQGCVLGGRASSPPHCTPVRFTRLSTSLAPPPTRTPPLDAHSTPSILQGDDR